MKNKKFTEYIGSQFRNPRGIVGTMCCIIMNLMNKPMYRSIIKRINVESNSNILDIGFGNGKLIRSLYKKTSAAIYGIDVSEDMVRLAGKKAGFSEVCIKEIVSGKSYIIRYIK